MDYMTICQRLLEDNPAFHDQLREQGLLLPTLERYSWELKTRHETWKATLSQTRPESDPYQIASEALEFALAEMEARLLPASPPAETEALNLDSAMAYLRVHTPHA